MPCITEVRKFFKEATICSKCWAKRNDGSMDVGLFTDGEARTRKESANFLYRRQKYRLETKEPSTNDACQTGWLHVEDIKHIHTFILITLSKSQWQMGQRPHHKVRYTESDRRKIVPISLTQDMSFWTERTPIAQAWRFKKKKNLNKLDHRKFFFVHSARY